jgi:hypothetical protein
VIAAAFLYGGWYVSVHYIPWYAWGMGAMGRGLAILIKHLFPILTASLHTAHQIDLLRESHKISYARTQLQRNENVHDKARGHLRPLQLRPAKRIVHRRPGAAV